MRIWLIVGAIVALIGWGELRHYQGATGGKNAEALECATADGARKDEIITASNEDAQTAADVGKIKSQIEVDSDADMQVIRQTVDDCINQPVPDSITERLFTEN
jgi:hypothetical protein